MRQGLRYRYRRIEKIRNDPHSLQQNLFHYLIQNGKQTQYGEKYSFANIRSLEQYKNQVPLVEYDDVKPYIFETKKGSPDILWPGITKWFAKSSGTTSDKSKYIPVTKQKLYQSHIRTNWDVLSVLYKQNDSATIFSKKGLILTGSVEQCPRTNNITGDVSAIMLHNIPKVARPFYTPSVDIGLLPDWEEKIEKMITLCPKEDVGMIGGVPTWTLVLLRRILEVTGKRNILEVWPNLSVYFHGGVGFHPYKDLFDSIMPMDKVFYLEAYNASEGYFAIQDYHGTEDMLLMLDNGVYYEFLPMGEFDSATPKTVSLRDVEVDTTYAIVVSTSAGLWRYVVGDTIQFTSVRPYRIQLTGRVQHFINVFGEEVMTHNTDVAIATTCQELGAQIAEYTVGPVFMDTGNQGRHQWVIEFERTPKILDEFEKQLDKNLQNINSDYEAKRFKDLALSNLEIIPVDQGTFKKWLRYKGKVGAQQKIPRLSNSRAYIEDLLTFINHK